MAVCGGGKDRVGVRGWKRLEEYICGWLPDERGVDPGATDVGAEEEAEEGVEGEALWLGELAVERGIVNTESMRAELELNV